jgi:hypothetical protein
MEHKHLVMTPNLRSSGLDILQSLWRSFSVSNSVFLVPFMLRRPFSLVVDPNAGLLSVIEIDNTGGSYIKIQ